MELYVALFENNLVSQVQAGENRRTIATRLRRPNPDRPCRRNIEQGDAPGVADTVSG